MTTRMLIDARHREETRVAVVQNNRIEEFDFESAERKQLKGNIYLAKVTRVEPSLQAAFVDYGGNRHGFLAFSEIHPDYYQIPKEDREALLREEAEFVAEEAALRDVDGDDDHDDDADEDGGDDHAHDDAEHDEAAEGEEGDAPAPRPRRSSGGDDGVEALRQRRQNLRRRYKIQDVIRRRQVLLVQVVKEERGNKGAALTTYLSLAGRYCVLMPNTSHGGGISRKISNTADRKRLKTIMADLKLPASMGCIVRTAGLQRTRTEIRRDFDYLARLWDGIRDKTLHSSAPSLVYGDSDLIKRAIRDIYNKDIDEVIVEGEEGYRQAREFMRLLMPSHAKRVRHYSDAVPLYQRSHVEDQLAAMYHPVVQLKSGGYLVINPTEALVSIDINSGRSTREHNIEQTATATNLEAAHEIARQLRLRDMAGLVVIDFIDMDNNSNVRKVEKAMKEALKNDRARIQVGRISSFGLLEMSRQRIRTGVLEASTRACPHCEGTGLVRTASSSGISALRLIEDEAARGRGSVLTLRASQEAAVYVLNRKRADIAEIEERYGVQIEIFPERDEEGARMSVEASGPPPAYAPRILPPIEEIEEDIPEEIEIEEDEVVEEEPETDAGEATPRAERPERSERGEGEGRGRRRRRRGRRNRSEGDESPEAGGVAEEAVLTEPADDAADQAGESDAIEAGEPAAVAEDEPGEGGRRRRGRRGRRGGRRGTRDETAGSEAEAIGAEDSEGEPLSTEPTGTDLAEAREPALAAAEPAEPELPVIADQPEPATPEPAEAPRPRRRPRARKADAPAEALPAEPTPQPEAEAPAKPKRSRRKAAEPTAEIVPAAPDVAEAEPAAKPKRSRKKATDAPVAEAPVEVAAAEPELPVIAEAAAIPAPAATPVSPPAADASATDTDVPADAPRRGWWQRTFGA